MGCRPGGAAAVKCCRVHLLPADVRSYGAKADGVIRLGGERGHI